MAPVFPSGPRASPCLRVGPLPFSLHPGMCSRGRMLNQLTISELTAKLMRREVSSREATQACLEQIARVDGQLHAFISHDAADALAQADRADAAVARGVILAEQPLLGVPIAIKDVIAVQGQPLSCASRILGSFVSPYDATAIVKLKAAGAVILGRLNLDEFAMGNSTETSAFGVTRNPWDLTRVPGGSSGGSAAAVAADECLAALGSDTGGSIRQPAAWCGCVGLKPTYGRVSRYGLTAVASSLDQIGCCTKDTRDAAILLGVIAGHDVRDGTSLPEPVPNYAAALHGGIQGVKVGLPREFMAMALAPDVRQAVEAAVRQLAQLGADIVEISLPHTEYAVATYCVIAAAEAAANLARFDGIRYGQRVAGDNPLELYSRTRGQGFGAEVKRRILFGTQVLSQDGYERYFRRAQKVRTLISQDFRQAFAKVAAVVAPVTPTAPFKLGEKTDDPLPGYLSRSFTIPANLAGLCGLSVPCGFTTAPQLPVGLQLLGPPLQEEIILRLAHAYEQSTAWHRAKPPLAPAGAAPA